MKRELNPKEDARRLLGMWLRQGDGGTFSADVPMVPALEKLVDRATAQRIWDELRNAAKEKRKQ